MIDQIIHDPKILIAAGDLILKVAVALFGGIWAVLLLSLLRQREQAAVNIRKSEAEIRDLDLKKKHVEAQISDLELKTRQAVILVDIRVEICRHRDDYIIVAVVELANCGSQNTRIIWEGQPPAFSVRMIRFNNDGGVDYDLIGAFRVPLTLDPKSEAPSHVVRAGGKESLPFTARIIPRPVFVVVSRCG
jgi:hypothetical protein